MAAAVLAAAVPAAALAACARGPAAPAIAVTYAFADTTFEAFLAEEVARARTGDEVALRILGGGIAYRPEGRGALFAEVRRATMLAGDPDVVVVVGPGGSREVLQVAPIYRDAGIAELIPTATSRLLANVGPFAFRLAADDSVQGEFIGAFVDSALAAESAVIIHIPDEYGVGLAAGTAAAFARNGVRLIDRIPVPLRRDCLTEAQRAAHAAVAAEVALRGVPDVAVLAMRETEAACLGRALRARFPRMRFVAGDGAYLDETFLERAGPVAEGFHLVAFWHPDLGRPGGREFQARFEARTGRRARHGDAMFFDAVMLAAKAARADGARRDRVLAYLRSLGTERPAFEGITGPVSFGAAAPRRLLMTRVTGGGSVIVR